LIWAHDQQISVFVDDVEIVQDLQWVVCRVPARVRCVVRLKLLDDVPGMVLALLELRELGRGIMRCSDAVDVIPTLASRKLAAVPATR
jgi:hypothetical protein